MGTCQGVGNEEETQRKRHRGRKGAWERAWAWVAKESKKRERLQHRRVAKDRERSYLANK